MSLVAFQRAVVELTLAPQKARALRDGDSGVIAAYNLTGLERDRLLDIVRQPGVWVNCTLARGNRLEVIAEAFPMTCVLLQQVLRQLVDELWSRHDPTNYQLAGEQAAFASLVNEKLGEGKLDIEYLPEIFHYEIVCLQLMQQARVQSGLGAAPEAIVEFQHSPDELMPPLSRLDPPVAGLQAGSFRARVTYQGERFDVQLLPSD